MIFFIFFLSKYFFNISSPAPDGSEIYSRDKWNGLEEEEMQEDNKRKEYQPKH